jgi:hypothetical protein
MLEIDLPLDPQKRETRNRLCQEDDQAVIQSSWSGWLSQPSILRSQSFRIKGHNLQQLSQAAAGLADRPVARGARGARRDVHRAGLPVDLLKLK